MILKMHKLNGVENIYLEISNISRITSNTSWARSYSCSKTTKIHLLNIEIFLDFPFFPHKWLILVSYLSTSYFELRYVIHTLVGITADEFHLQTLAFLAYSWLFYISILFLSYPSPKSDIDFIKMDINLVFTTKNPKTK